MMMMMMIIMSVLLQLTLFCLFYEINIKSSCGVICKLPVRWNVTWSFVADWYWDVGTSVFRASARSRHQHSWLCTASHCGWRWWKCGSISHWPISPVPGCPVLRQQVSLCQSTQCFNDCAVEVRCHKGLQSYQSRHCVYHQCRATYHWYVSSRLVAGNLGWYSCDAALLRSKWFVPCDTEGHSLCTGRQVAANLRLFAGICSHHVWRVRSRSQRYGADVHVWLPSVSGTHIDFCFLP